MAKTQTPAAHPVGDLFAFRLVVRGNDANGKRVRRVKNVMATDANDAAEKGDVIAGEVGADLSGLYFNVYPPIGEKCNGELSKGYEMVNGLIVKTSVPTTAVEVKPEPVKPAKAQRKAKATA